MDELSTGFTLLKGKNREWSKISIINSQKIALAKAAGSSKVNKGGCRAAGIRDKTLGLVSSRENARVAARGSKNRMTSRVLRVCYYDDC